MKELNARLKSGKIDRVYVFYGVETYLVNSYERRLIEAVFGKNYPLSTSSMNKTVFEGTSPDFFNIIETCETPPFLSKYRLVVIKNSGLLKPSSKSEGIAPEKKTRSKNNPEDIFIDYISKIPETTVLLFLEPEKGADKRSRLYKKIAESGLVVNFETPKENELVKWLCGLMKSKNYSIKPNTASAMIKQVCGSNNNVMELLHTETFKLISYLGDKNEATIYDIQTICQKSTESKIFSLVKNIGEKNLKALSEFADMIALKEPPMLVLNMISRQFRMILLCKTLHSNGKRPSEIASITGLRDFMVSEFLNQGRNFSEITLINALNDCLDSEVNFKSGKISDKLAVELLIIKYCS